MEHGIQYRIHDFPPVIPILSRINPIPHTDFYFFKIHSNIVFQSTPRPSKRAFSHSLTLDDTKYVVTHRGAFSTTNFIIPRRPNYITSTKILKSTFLLHILTNMLI